MTQQDLASAPQKSMVHTQDIDEQANNLTQWQQKYDQLSEGRFFGRIESVDYSNIQKLY